ncbi:hypothetical protein RHMOL_Rhmol12G0203500 [Rhododendron molle]|uniref:Uncharacterized protein n=3 Tax=Rhododendron molle TaxID=49168 RepID=A0ACC0LLN0_RHOML|nr:hypothetical protein RHMOL_Rhmol12G0203500 [Rhododendron molle]
MFHLAAGFMPTMIAPHMEGFITLSLFKVDGYLGDAGTLVDSYISEKIMQHKEQIATFRKRDKRTHYSSTASGFVATQEAPQNRAKPVESPPRTDPKALEPASRESLGEYRVRIGLKHDILVRVKQGFRYHYAEPSYLMLAKWIAETFDTLPANASHRVGIGAFVMNDMGEVLVVQENSGTFTGTGVWKAPTGVVDEFRDVLSADMGVASLGSHVAAILASPHAKGEAWGLRKLGGAKDPQRSDKRRKGATSLESLSARPREKLFDGFDLELKWVWTPASVILRCLSKQLPGLHSTFRLPVAYDVFLRK